MAYRRHRMQALFSVFLGYLTYYIACNNFTLSTPYFKRQLDLSITQTGVLNSCVLITYGINKEVMSSLADKASPRIPMACGLMLCAIVNVGLGFSTAFWIFAASVILNGFLQGMGVGPSFATITNWLPHREYSRVGAFWNTSHNIGGDTIAPTVGVAFALLGSEHQRSVSYIVPACTAIVSAVIMLILGKSSPHQEGLPSLREMVSEERVVLNIRQTVRALEDMNAFQIFCIYVLRNKNAWCVSLVDAFVYMVCFGVISWLPIYLPTVKHSLKGQMGVTFLFSEWTTAPPTLFAGWLSDKLFKGRYMPSAMICTALIFTCLIGYWRDESLFIVTISATAVGCLIYVPQFLASVRTVEIMSNFAVDSVVGLRGFISYISGVSLGTSLFGTMVGHAGWHGGFYLLGCGIIRRIIFCWLSHHGATELERHRAVYIKEH